jgi:hypothetical protein
MTDIKDIWLIALGVAITSTVSIMAYASLTEKPTPGKTHYSICVDNTYPKCVLANKTLPSLETFCKVATEIQCKELKL